MSGTEGAEKLFFYTGVRAIGWIALRLMLRSNSLRTFDLIHVTYLSAPGRYLAESNDIDLAHGVSRKFL